MTSPSETSFTLPKDQHHKNYKSGIEKTANYGTADFYTARKRFREQADLSSIAKAISYSDGNVTRNQDKKIKITNRNAMKFSLSPFL